jgi:hypothetical protein
MLGYNMRDGASSSNASDHFRILLLPFDSNFCFDKGERFSI